MEVVEVVDGRTKIGASIPGLTLGFVYQGLTMATTNRFTRMHWRDWPPSLALALGLRFSGTGTPKISGFSPLGLLSFLGGHRVKVRRSLCGSFSSYPSLFSLPSITHVSTMYQHQQHLDNRRRIAKKMI